MTKTETKSRTIVAEDASGKTSGRNAAEWRNDTLIKLFGTTVDLTAKVQTKAWVKPKYEIHEREVARRTYGVTLVERAKNGKVTEVAKAKVGLFGNLIEKPSFKDEALAG